MLLCILNIASFQGKTSVYTVKCKSIGGVMQSLLFWLCTPADWLLEIKQYEVKVQIVSFNLRLFTSISGNLCKNYSLYLYMALPF